MRERDLDRMFVAACKRRGIVTYKTSSVMRRGFADRTLFGPGPRMGFVELKGAGSKMTPAQDKFNELAFDARAFVAVLRAEKSRAETAAVIERLLDRYMVYMIPHREVCL